MIIGASRVAVGPLRDLDQLDRTVDLLERVPGVGAVAVEAFVGRRVLLTVHAQHPLDLAGALRDQLGGGLRSCGIVGERLEVVLAESTDHPADDVAPQDDAVDATWEEDEDPAPTTTSAGIERHVPQRAAPTMVVSRELLAGRRERLIPAEPGELLELSFAHAPVAKALISTDGRWLRVNRRLCRLLRRDEATLLRCDLQELTHPDDLGAGHVLVREALDGARDGWSLETRWIAADGEVLPVRVEVSLVRAGDGEPRWFVFEVVEHARAARSRALVAPV
ncbi:PAS domain S-box protein [Patulibacter minatonensis]|uniref:PAS domain S-box protein n=1 Tax=Patulibacter minatonensis TaxID=298163 RepID=UPI00047BF387|nr:PAS domain S-box protein [Patulibacter minatonensis]